MPSKYSVNVSPADLIQLQGTRLLQPLGPGVLPTPPNPPPGPQLLHAPAPPQREPEQAGQR